MSVLITGCNLFDPLEKRIEDKVNILIQDDRIEEVTHDRIPSGKAEHTLDGKGLTALPGLMNLHTHPQRHHARFMKPGVPFRFGAAAVEGLPTTQRLLFAIKNAWHEMMHEGVTTMRCAGSKDYLNIELRNTFADGPVRGPRIFSTGPILAITGGHGTLGIDGAMEVDGPDAMRKTVRATLKAGADWIKLCVSGGLAGIHAGDHPTLVEFTEEEVRVAVEEAHKRGKKVMVHGMASASVKMAVRAGVDCIEHGNLLDDEAIAAMKQKGVYFVPTMSGIYNVYERERRAENKRVADMLWEMVKPQPEAVAKAFKAGVLIGTGTDTLGFTHQEVEMFTQCGMSPEQALRAATYDSARILGRETELGSVAPGKKADLVLLEGDPVKELSALKRVRTVILNGRIVTWDYLITGDGRS